MESGKKSPLISRSAATLLVICFFFPWISVSCSGQQITATGYELATGIEDMQNSSQGEAYSNGDMSYFLIPAIGVIVLVASFIFGLSLARTIYLASGIVGFGFLLLKMFDFQQQVSDLKNQGYIVNVTYEMGWWLALLSLAGIIAAGILSRTEEKSDAVQNT